LLYVAVGVAIADQITKYFIQSHLALNESIEVIPDFFNLTYIKNPGAAFGILGRIDEPIRLILLLTLSVIAFTVLIAIFIKSPSRECSVLIAIALILGGAVGNLIDRIRFGWVVDFLDFYIRGYHWPAFNLADTAISIGACILILNALLHKKNRYQTLRDV